MAIGVFIVKFNIEAHLALHDTDKPLGDTTIDLRYQQMKRLEGSNPMN